MRGGYYVFVAAILQLLVVSAPNAIAEALTQFVPTISEEPSNKSALVVSGQGVAPILVDPLDQQPAGIAGELLADDVFRVTGSRPAILAEIPRAAGLPGAIIIGTIGHSRLIDKLIADQLIDVASIRGQWESYLIKIVDHPFPNIPRAVVIAGSDRRGTAYGAMTLSKAIGVSPWYWWADVPVKHHAALYVRPVTVIDGPPAVKYRGIFLNDEAPCLTGWSKEKFGGLNSKMYVHVFELLLRLRANYLWPAMWGGAFNEDDPKNPSLANDYGIVMGTSHQEPMLRAQAEFDHRHPGKEWNYATHPDVMEQFWRQGIKRNKDFESLITIGMRGRNDTPMIEGASVAQSSELLQKIVTRQREILTEEMAPRTIEQIPQVWCLYKEVQEYYERGLRVPDDVTMLWSDDNWGNIRRVPTDNERNRAGGAGIYYHFDYVGSPRSYKWINTNSIAKTWEQMSLAYAYGADRVWIVNVGDLKPMEYPIDFFMTLAWNPAGVSRESLGRFSRDWATAQFGPEHAVEIAALVEWYTRLNNRRHPEFLDGPTYDPVNYDEADRVLAECQEMGHRADDLSTRMPAEFRDAFFQLVQHPVKATAVVNEIYILAGKNKLYAGQGRRSANRCADEVQALYKADASLSDEYNSLNNGRWNHMMDQTHLGYTDWSDPKNNSIPALYTVHPVKGKQCGVAIESDAAGLTSKEPTADLPGFDLINDQLCWVEIFNKGDQDGQFAVSGDVPWIRIDRSSGTVDQDVRLRVSVDWSKCPPGDADGLLTVTCSGQNSGIKIHLTAHNFIGITREQLAGFVENEGVVSIDADHYTSKIATSSARWEVVDGLGRTGSSMSIFPQSAASVDAVNLAPCLNYRMYVFESKSARVELTLSPTQNFLPHHGLRIAVAFDGQVPVLVDCSEHYDRAWSEEVATARRVVPFDVALTGQGPGYHTLHVWALDSGTVLQKIVVNLGGERPSYLGPPESLKGPMPVSD